MRDFFCRKLLLVCWGLCFCVTLTEISYGDEDIKKDVVIRCQIITLAGEDAKILARRLGSKIASDYDGTMKLLSKKDRVEVLTFPLLNLRFGILKKIKFTRKTDAFSVDGGVEEVGNQVSFIATRANGGYRIKGSICQSDIAIVDKENTIKVTKKQISIDKFLELGKVYSFVDGKKIYIIAVLSDE